MHQVNFSIDRITLDRLLATPIAVAAAAAVGVKRVGNFNLSDTGISFKFTAKRCRVKIKLGLGARDGALHANLRDLRVNGVSTGGNWLEAIVANVAHLTRSHGALVLKIPGVYFRGAGITPDNRLFVIANIGGK